MQVFRECKIIFLKNYFSVPLEPSFEHFRRLKRVLRIQERIQDKPPRRSYDCYGQYPVQG